MAWPERPTRCRKVGDRARRAELADEIHVADVDAEFERGGRDQRLQLAALEPLLGREPVLLRHAAVMRRDRAFAQALRQFAGDALGHAARVDEHQRRALRLDEPRHPIVDFGPHLARHHRLERRAGQNQAEVARALMAGVDDRGVGAGAPSEETPTRNRATAPIGFCVADRPMRCSRPPHERSRRSSERARCAPRLFGAMAWISSTITERAVASILRPGFRAQQHVERFRRRHQDMRRAAAHALALGGRRVARSAPRRGSRHRGARTARKTFPDAGERRLQVAVDVVRQRLERRNVDHLGLIGRAAPRDPDGPDRRSPRGRPQASCPSRSARRSGCGGPP